jgi:hypothetical protein
VELGTVSLNLPYGLSMMKKNYPIWVFGRHWVAFEVILIVPWNLPMDSMTPLKGQDTMELVLFSFQVKN